ncbi:serine hydrolase domain-containing protein [Qipengyuania sp. ASV99]|uniref:serine hydrolase domain-containing protein n=1 Tax=Qipengyuania sp. ASV99 TaxID=3399681 RepID=UPI003A4C7541
MLRIAITFCLAALAAPASADDFDFDGLSAVIAEAGFEGDLAISTGLGDPTQTGPRYSHTDLLPEPWRGWPDGLTWRWASVTKQMVAVLVMQQVERGVIDLDEPVASYLPDFASDNAETATIRNLLQHRAGLPNPDSSESGLGDPYAYYSADFRGSRDPVSGFCAGPVTGKPGGEWSYNNCDYMVLGAVLEAVTGLSWDALFMRDIAAPLGLEFVGAYPGEDFTRWGWMGEAREPERDLSVYGASAGLYGSLDDLLAIDVALMRGDLLGKAALAQMWDGNPELGFMALGQWVFEAPLNGCEAPVRIVERRGGIGAVQVRNFIIPERQMAVVAFSQREPFEFGEIWMGSGFSYELLSKAVCQP